MKRSLINRCAAITLVVIPLLFVNASVFSQQNSSAAGNKEIPVKELLTLPGKLVSEATSARPTNELKLTGYRVEEVRLPRSLTVEMHGQQVVVDRAWRVTVNGGPFPVRAMPAVIWIDDQIVGNGVENETLSQVTAITFDSSLIREGGAVSISYGPHKETRVRIPQRLQLKREGGNQ
jgi:hypothetical protein